MCGFSRIFHLYLPLSDEGQREETVEDQSLLWMLPPGRVFWYDLLTEVTSDHHVTSLGKSVLFQLPVFDVQSGATRHRWGTRPKAGPILPGLPCPQSTLSTPAPQTTRPHPPTPARKTWRVGDPAWVRNPKPGRTSLNNN